MSLVFNEKYPGKTAGATQNYPYGEARNVSGPGNGDGTPWDAALVNDIFGLLQGLLVRAGITPNGRSDTAIDSQYLQALLNLFMPRISPAKADLSENGFISLPFLVQNLPNEQPYQAEFTIQWGVSGNIFDAGTSEIIFKKPYKNYCFNVQVTENIMSTYNANAAHVAAVNVTKNGFDLKYNSTILSTTQAFWFAIGV